MVSSILRGSHIDALVLVVMHNCREQRSQEANLSHVPGPDLREDVALRQDAVHVPHDVGRVNPEKG